MIDTNCTELLQYLLNFNTRLQEGWRGRALFSSPWKPKSFQDFPSHRILWHMHETLNIDEKKN